MFYFILFIIVIIIIIVIINQGKSNSSESFKKSSSKSPAHLDISFPHHDPPIIEDGVYLFFDVETTGLPKRRNAAITNNDNWPRIVQIAWLLFNDKKEVVFKGNYYVKIDEPIPVAAQQIHGITNKKLKAEGKEPEFVFSEFYKAYKQAKYFVAHNIDFDLPIIQNELFRLDYNYKHDSLLICTMKSTTDFCSIPKRGSNSYKYPTLSELAKTCFFRDNDNLSISNLHDAYTDIFLTAKCFYHLIENEGFTIDYFVNNTNPDQMLKNIDTSNIPDNPFKNKKVVITGKFSIPRHNVKAFLIERGAVISASISSKTDFIVLGESPGPAKLIKIQEIIDNKGKLKVLNEDEFFSMLSLTS